MNAAAERFFVRHSALPTMPEVASRLLKSFDDDNVGLAQVAALIEKDSTLAAKVLRLANTAHYSPSHQIATVLDAAHALGLETLRNLTLAACLSGAFPAVKGLDRATFWRHSVARLRPVTMPSRAESAWNSMATRLASSTTHNSM